MTLNINTTMEINSVLDLNKLKTFVEVNMLDKPNFSEIGRKLGVDRRTVKKYYDGNTNHERKKKISKLDNYYDIIESLLSNNTLQKFYYKSHLYRYLVREHGLDCSRSNFNYFILNHPEFEEKFNSKVNNHSIKSETPFGKQAQFDWKEKLKFTFKDGTKMTLNVGSLVLSASRFKVWAIYPSTNQNNLFDFLSRAFETIGGVPKEIIIDNASTMMDKARTESSEGEINVRFAQLANDFGFEIVPCVRARPKTKAKVENPMRIVDEIMNYNGIVENIEQLSEKMNLITNETNARICQATGIPPILVFKKEKEHLLPLPNSKICSYYKNTTVSVTVNTNALFKYKTNMYSVPAEYIGKTVALEANADNLYVYYNRKLVTMHSISKGKINYNKRHHKELTEITFRGQEKEKVADYAEKHFKELEKFNEQLSEIM